MLYCLLDHRVDRLGYSYVTQQSQAIDMPAFHLLYRVFKRATDCRHLVAMAEGRFY